MRSVARRVLVVVLTVSLVVPWSAAADARTVQQLLAQARANLDIDEPAAAEKQYSAVLRLQPSNVAALVGRGTALRRLDRLDEALTDFQAAIRLDPGNSDAYCGRGAVCALQNDFLRARADCDQALRLNPNNSDAYYWRGYAHGNTYEPEKAIQDLSRAIELNPRDSWAFYSRGAVEHNSGQIDKAITDFSAAIELDPKFALALWARAASEKNDLRKALADIDAAIRLGSDNAEWYRLRGSIYEKKGKADLAKKDFDRSREIGLKDLLHELALPPASEQPTERVEALEKRIVQQVKSLEYDDQVGRSVVLLVRDWNLVALSRELETVRALPKITNLAQPQLAKVEQNVAAALAHMINVVIMPIDPKNEAGGRELSDVSEDKTAWCQGIELLFFVLGNAIGLSTEGLEVVVSADGPDRTGTTHDACIVRLADGDMIMVDATRGLDNGSLVSEAFRFDKVFRPCGSYWELKDKSNPLGLHRLVQPANASALVAQIYVCRAACCLSKGNIVAAREKVAAAMQRNPQSVGAYWFQGRLHVDSHEIVKAIADFTKAIALNPDDANEYAERGSCLVTRGNRACAISDFGKALELNPQLSCALAMRGRAYAAQGDFAKAIPDLSEVIRLDPISADAYKSRADLYARNHEINKAAADYAEAERLKPSDDRYR